MSSQEQSIRYGECVVTSSLQQKFLWGVEFIGAIVCLPEPLLLLGGEVRSRHVVDIAPVLLLG